VRIMHRAHVPTALVVLGVVLAMFVLYHMCFGRRRVRREEF
jgi:hypothetical protein